MKKAFVILLLVISLGACLKKGKVVEPDSVPIARWYELKLGERLNINKWDQLTRVPGGWVLTHQGPYAWPMVFIPYSEEGR